MFLKKDLFLWQQSLSPLPFLCDSLRQHLPVPFLAMDFLELFIGVAARGLRAVEGVLLEEVGDGGVQGHFNSGLALAEISRASIQ